MDSNEICSANLVEKMQLLITIMTFLRETSFVSQILLDDFRLSHGYKTIVDIAVRLEKENTNEAKLALRNLFFCVEEFMSAGFNELKPSSSNINTNMFKIEGFQIPQPIGKGRTVRNTNAFQCLLNIFNKAQAFDTCMMVLDTIRNIYKKDECNYFILESQNLLLYSLDDSSIKIHNRTNDIQVNLFNHQFGKINIL